MGLTEQISVLFIVTAIISYFYFRKMFKNPNGTSPWLGKTPYERTPGGMEAGGKDPVWNTDTQDIGGGVHHRTESGGTERGCNQKEGEDDAIQVEDGETKILTTAMTCRQNMTTRSIEGLQDIIRRAR